MVHKDIVFKENRLFDPIEPKCDLTDYCFIRGE